MKQPVVTMSLLGLMSLSLPEASSASVRQFDFADYLSQKYAPDCGKRAIEINSVSFADVDGDGSDEALIVASSCLTGTAGPDIHAVVRFDKSGQLRDLPIDDAKGRFKGRRIYDGLVGNRNYSLEFRDGVLLERFMDTSGRAAPLTLRFRWTGRRFRLVDVERARTFRASFDCATAHSDAENTICGNAELAEADRQLATLYKSLLGRLSTVERRRLMNEQKRWLAERDHCTYKSVDECLRKAYSDRLAALREWR
jgi:uncharacterized protein YecT (DUF1311 family)